MTFVSGRFLQTPEWAVFQQTIGRRVHVMETDSARAFFVEYALPFGWTYWFCPKGPVSADSSTHKRLVERALDQAKESGALFVRIEPTIAPTIGHRVDDLHPSTTFLTPIAADWMAQAHPKTRYNIGLARRRGVRVEMGVALSDSIWTLFEQTARRDKFRLHARSYYETLLRVLNTDTCRATLSVAFLDQQPLACVLSVDHDGVRTYVHGASSNFHRDCMAPHLLHARLIDEATARQFQAYDWWGIAPTDDKRHPWSGITRFKKGFGGAVVSSPGTFEIPIAPIRAQLVDHARFLRYAWRRLRP